jgi:ubiquitin carboxyl-terminal hydrolase 36/42
MTKESSTVHEPFWILSLDVHGTLRESLKAFRRIEHITGDNVWISPKSAKCKMSPLYTTKRLVIDKWPDGALYFHLKRFSWAKCTKDMREVSLPMRILNGTLDLVAVVVHQGASISGGHYMCCVRYPDKHWYLCDDAHVKEIATADVQSTYIPHAYIVAYA